MLIEKTILTLGEKFYKLHRELNYYVASGVFKPKKKRGVDSKSQEVRFYEGKTPSEAMDKLVNALLLFEKNNEWYN